MAKWMRTDDSEILDTDDLQLSKSMRLLSTDLGQQLLGQPHYTVKKILARQYECWSDGRVYINGDGYAIIDDSDKPLAWKNDKGAVTIEVYRLKYIAVLQADQYNCDGLYGFATVLAVRKM